MSYSITKNGKDVRHLCVIDEKSKTVSTTEDGLVFHFSGLYGWTFKTGSDCTLKTGNYCTFKTSSDCTFDTGDDCTFKTGSRCTFDTGPWCTFNTGSLCTFKTGYGCTFNTGSGCTFKTGMNCFVIRRDTHECIEVPDYAIKLVKNCYEKDRLFELMCRRGHLNKGNIDKGFLV